MILEVLVGMIASGKTTYALQRARTGAMIVSHDQLTEMYHGEYRYEHTDDMRSLYRRSEELLVTAILEAGKDCVIDRTHLTHESRARWIKFAREFHVNGAPSPVEVRAVLFPIETPEIHADRRFFNDARGRTHNEWLTVATYHFEQAKLEPFNPTEGFRTIYRRNHEDHESLFKIAK